MLSHIQGLIENIVHQQAHVDHLVAFLALDLVLAIGVEDNDVETVGEVAADILVKISDSPVCTG